MWGSNACIHFLSGSNSIALKAKNEPGTVEIAFDQPDIIATAEVSCTF